MSEAVASVRQPFLHRNRESSSKATRYLSPAGSEAASKARMKTRVAVRDEKPHRFQVLPLKEAQQKPQSQKYLKDNTPLLNIRKQLKPVASSRAPTRPPRLHVEEIKETIPTKPCITQRTSTRQQDSLKPVRRDSGVRRVERPRHRTVTESSLNRSKIPTFHQHARSPSVGSVRTLTIPQKSTKLQAHRLAIDADATLVNETSFIASTRVKTHVSTQSLSCPSPRNDHRRRMASIAGEYAQPRKSLGRPSAMEHVKRHAIYDSEGSLRTIMGMNFTTPTIIHATEVSFDDSADSFPADLSVNLSVIANDGESDDGDSTAASQTIFSFPQATCDSPSSIYDDDPAIIDLFAANNVQPPVQPVSPKNPVPLAHADTSQSLYDLEHGLLSAVPSSNSSLLAPSPSFISVTNSPPPRHAEFSHDTGISLQVPSKSSPKPIPEWLLLPPPPFSFWRSQDTIKISPSTSSLSVKKKARRTQSMGQIQAEPTRRERMSVGIGMSISMPTLNWKIWNNAPKKEAVIRHHPIIENLLEDVDLALQEWRTVLDKL
ncbi:hypothetical protein C8J56DRAFT_1114739 [Mycena floridula]|nr:hypothetical protein C8J56DRAFT_1125995 [Mycena floridula]KAJ7577095.1 hypothetical protein C8J56DRAFT_1114739 [Mycena floridula]